MACASCAASPTRSNRAPMRFSRKSIVVSPAFRAASTASAWAGWNCSRWSMRRARRRLPALVQPEAGHHGREVGPPDAGHEARRLGGRHDAGRRAHDVGQPSRILAGAPSARLAADRADAAGMGVDQRRRRPAFPATGRVPPRRPASGRCPSAVPGSTMILPIRAALVGKQLAQPDPLEIAAAPALLVRQIGPFAGQRAGRARQAAWSPARTDSRRDRRNARPLARSPGDVLQPQELRRLHLRRDDAADIAQHVVVPCR